jgi:DNA-binding MarR family transcriptional regulator
MQTDRRKMEKQIGMQIKKLSNLIRRRMMNNPVLKEINDITSTQGLIIGYIAHHEKVYQRDLEQQFNIRRSTVTKLLQAMEANGLIRRVSVQEDARLKQIKLTDKATDIYKRIEEQIKQTESVLRNGLTEKEITTLNLLFDKLAQNLILDSGEDTGKC